MVAAFLLPTCVGLAVRWDVMQSGCRRGLENGGCNSGNLSGRTRAVAFECSLRDKGLSKKPLWRTKEDMSSEAKQASASLRLAKGEEAVARVMATTVSRLLKPDLLALLAHLQRTDCCDLAIRVKSRSLRSAYYFYLRHCLLLFLFVKWMNRHKDSYCWRFESVVPTTLNSFSSPHGEG